MHVCTEEKGRVDTPCLQDGSCLDMNTVCESTTYRCQCDDQHYSNGTQCRTYNITTNSTGTSRSLDSSCPDMNTACKGTTYRCLYDVLHYNNTS